MFPPLQKLREPVGTLFSGDEDEERTLLVLQQMFQQIELRGLRDFVAEQIDLAGNPESLSVSLNGQDVTERIRDEDVTNISSIISTIPAVRRAMVKRQRELGQRGAVMNGRDIGTVVFPEADIKFFLTASPAERAQRRLVEERKHNPAANYDDVFADMTERDRRDTTRTDSPLIAASDAVIIDSTGVPLDHVFQRMIREIERRE